MVLKPDDKVLIVHRRLFEKDSTRYFIGAVEEYDGGLARATEFTFSQDLSTGHVHKKADQTTKIVAISSGTVLVYLLAGDLQINSLQFAQADSKLSLVDDVAFKFDLTEH